jgi:predicted SprT family Zn-dependent metalloprotease
MVETTHELLQRQAQAILEGMLPLAEKQLDGLVRQTIPGRKAHLPECSLVVRNLGRSAGKVIGGTVIINQQLANHPDSLYPTVAHELAHVVVEQARRQLRIRHRNGQWSAHGAVWRRVATALGDTGKRCHDLNLEPSRTVSRYLYRLPDGTERHLSAVRHHRLQKNRYGAYHWPGDSEPVRWQHLVGRIED